MHDLTERWPDPRGLNARIIRDGLSILPLPPRPMTMISGPVERGLALCGQLRAWGWPDPVPDGPVALRLRRDRILMLGGPQLEDGWSPRRGLAISRMDGAWLGLILGGRRAFDLIRMGTEISLSQPSASVMRQFSGVEVALWRSAEEEFSLLVPAPHAAYLWQLLTGFAEDLAPPHADFRHL